MARNQVVTADACIFAAAGLRKEEGVAKAADPLTVGRGG